MSALLACEFNRIEISVDDTFKDLIVDAENVDL